MKSTFNSELRLFSSRRSSILFFQIKKLVVISSGSVSLKTEVSVEQGSVLVTDVVLLVDLVEDDVPEFRGFVSRGFFVESVDGLAAEVDSVGGGEVLVDSLGCSVT